MSLTVLWGGGAGLSPPSVGVGWGWGPPPLLGVSPPMSPPAGGVSNAFPPANNAVMGGIWGVPRWVGVMGVGRGVGPPRLTPPIGTRSRCLCCQCVYFTPLLLPPPQQGVHISRGAPPAPPPIQQHRSTNGCGWDGRCVCGGGGQWGSPFCLPPPPSPLEPPPPAAGRSIPEGGGPHYAVTASALSVRGVHLQVGGGATSVRSWLTPHHPPPHKSPPRGGVPDAPPERSGRRTV